MDINWLQLWQDLITQNRQSKSGMNMIRYNEHVRKRHERPDPLLDFLISKIDSLSTVIDIGSGNGRWTIPLARKVKKVTAIEPSQEMAEILVDNIKSAGLSNIEVISSTWEKVSIEKHDVSVCAHAMYNSPDLAGFTGKMERSSRQMCYLSVRIPPVNGVIAELSRMIYGRSHDSANAIIAFNALYSMGKLPNLLIEEGIINWTSNSYEEAFTRVKRHLSVESTTDYNDEIMAVLYRCLKLKNGQYIWPDGMRSALIFWKPV